MKVLSGWELGKAMVEAGILPENCRRAVIDIPVDGPVVIYVEQFGTEQLLEILPSAAKGAEIRILKPEPEPVQEAVT